MDDDAPVGFVLTRREVLRLMGFAAGSAFLAACAPLSSGTSATATSAPSTPALGDFAARTPAGAAVALTEPTAAATAAAQVTVAAEANATAAAAAASTPAGIATGAPAIACVVRPEMTVGPYFVDEQLERSDIRSEPSDNSVREGVPLVLSYNVSTIANSACTPLSGAQVDVWHCDAAGVYSGVDDPTQGANNANTTTKFLRGWQKTGADGTASFTTIYPGWYRGRTTHIHFKIRTPAAAEQIYEFTSQLFFDETLNDQVYALQPYAAKGQRNTTNATDRIYQNGGDQMTLAPTGDTSNGLQATFMIALDLPDTQTGQADTNAGPGGGPDPRQP